jgi:pimeloyl-ACP methyl ester carboxylesterase
MSKPTAVTYNDVNGVKFHYIKGGPRSVVLIPGWLQTGYAWRKVMPQAGKDLRVVALDTRGTDDPSRPDDGYDMQTAANDVAVVVNKLGVSRYPAP